VLWQSTNRMVIFRGRYVSLKSVHSRSNFDMRSSKVFQQALSAVEALNVGTSSFLPSWILEVRKASHRW
jgi:hypothetical protein